MVGTKIIIAKLIGHLESIGIDLVNLNINDLITSGAVPLFFLDYISASELNAVEIEAIVRTSAQTGVEMEALTAVSVAALTVYDMMKALDKTIVIGSIRLIKKSGGRSGLFEGD